MDMQTAQEIFEAMSNTQLLDLLDELLESAVKYAHIRANWTLMTREERMAANDKRTAAHNALIDHCNILSRNMIKIGEDARWRLRLTDDRKIIGDFACYLHCFFGIKAR